MPFVNASLDLFPHRIKGDLPVHCLDAFKPFGDDFRVFRDPGPRHIDRVLLFEAERVKPGALDFGRDMEIAQKLLAAARKNSQNQRLIDLANFM